MEQIRGNEGLIHVVGIIHIWAKVEGKLAEILIKTKAKNLLKIADTSDAYPLRITLTQK